MSEQLTPMAELCRRANADDAGDALEAVTELRGRLRTLEQQAVARMLGEGAGWAQIGAALGISRQAAHRRFRDVTPVPRTATEHAQVERILVTGDARETVRLAREEAIAKGAPRVGTEHLLVALARNPSPAVAYALRASGLDADRLRSALQPTVASEQANGNGTPTFTANAREVLEGTLREAVERGDGFIAPEHLLLALLRNPEGGAARTLEALGVPPANMTASIA